MGTASRLKPERLAGKLKTIRQGLNLTLDELILRLNCPAARLLQSSVSRFESGIREPPLPVLLQYARIANVYLEVLVDDELSLPAKLPSRQKSEGTMENN